MPSQDPRRKGSSEKKENRQPTPSNMMGDELRSQSALSRFALEQTLFPSDASAVLSGGLVNPEIRVQDLLLSELQTARQLNVAFPENPLTFIHNLEQRIQELTGTQKSVILILDEESGTYTCLNDEVSLDVTRAPQELTWISDTFLQDWLGSDQFINSFLHTQGSVLGIVAVANKVDGTPFTLKDEITLEQLSQYLSVQVNHYLTMKKALVQPRVQSILLDVSTKLLSAVDSSAIFQYTLGTLLNNMPFTAGQYIELERQTGEGQVLYQLDSYGCFEHGLPLHTIDGFAAILGLFQSQVWQHNYLYFKGSSLGDKPFSDVFGLEGIESVVILPIRQHNQATSGALVLFQQHQSISLSKDALQTLERINELVVGACQRAQVLEKALTLATTDELTESLNRRGFYSRFDAEVDRARRSHSSMCLAMIDVDYFKRVNDTYGHLAGDEILQGLAKLLQANVRKSDLVCRFGGEEFALLLPETSLEQGAELMERLRVLTEEHRFQTSAGLIPITFSAGISLIVPAEHMEQDTLQMISMGLAKADEALYDAKQSGRNLLKIAH